MDGSGRGASTFVLLVLNSGFFFQLLMCDRCQRGYHVECLGPYYPTEPEGEDDVWVSKVNIGIVCYNPLNFFAHVQLV